MKALSIALFVLAGVSMIGQGSRMLFQGLVFPGSHYVPVMFDLLFDWTTMLVLGVALFAYAIRTFHQDRMSVGPDHQVPGPTAADAAPTTAAGRPGHHD